MLCVDIKAREGTDIDALTMHSSIGKLAANSCFPYEGNGHPETQANVFPSISMEMRLTVTEGLV